MKKYNELKKHYIKKKKI